MKTIQKIILGLFLLIGITSNAQNNTGEIQGKVFEEESNEPLAFAHVFTQVGEQKIGTTTDLDGKFVLKPLKPGVYNVTVTYVGKDSILISKIEVDPEKITYIKDCYVTDGKTMTGIVKYAWKRKLIDKGNPSIQSIGMKEIQQSPLMRSPVELLEVTVPGISVDANGGVNIRGSRTGDVGYYIDGVKSTSLSGIPGRAIGNMSVYTGGVPAQYGDITGGVIIVETVSYFDLYNAHKARQKKLSSYTSNCRRRNLHHKRYRIL